MVEEHALVVAVDEGSAWVETQRRSVCGQCSANKGCGTAVLQNVLGNKRNVIRVLNKIPVNVGDEVIIGINEDALVKGSMLIYALPIAAMIVFALLGETFVARWLSIETDLMSMLGALFGLVLSVAALRWHSNRVRYNTNYQPVLLRHANEVTFESQYKILG